MLQACASVVLLVFVSPGFAQGLVVGPAWSGAFAIGDVDADGRAEVMVYDPGTTVFTVFDGATGVPLPYLQRTGGNYVDIGDYDGDGCDDLAHNLPAAVTVVSGRDGSVLTIRPGSFVGVRGGDVDGDGRSDLLLEEQPQPVPSITRYMSAISSRTGVVLWQQALGGPLAGFTAGDLAVIGDENGDGLEDAVYQVVVTLPITAPTTRLVRGPATMLTLDRLQPLGDVDGDGAVDSLTQSSSTFLWRIVAGGSGVTVWAPGLSGPTVRRLNDIDGDGHADFFLVDSFAGISARIVSGATFLPLPGFVPGSPSNVPQPIGDRDADGRVDFDTCFPGWYSSRAVHIHFAVRRGQDTYATAQLFFEQTLIDGIYASEPLYSVRGLPDTPNTDDKVLGDNDPSMYTLEWARMADGAMQAWKTVVIRAALADATCSAPESSSGGAGGPPGA